MLRDGKCCVSPIINDAMPLVGTIMSQLSQVKYNAEYLLDSFFENDTSPPLAIPFKTAIDAARIVKATRENENTKYIPTKARQKDTSFILVTFSPRKPSPTTYIVRSIVTKKSNVAEPISIWLKA